MHLTFIRILGVISMVLAIVSGFSTIVCGMDIFPVDENTAAFDIKVTIVFFIIFVISVFSAYILLSAKVL